MALLSADYFFLCLPSTLVDQGHVLKRHTLVGHGGCISLLVNDVGCLCLCGVAILSLGEVSFRTLQWSLNEFLKKRKKGFFIYDFFSYQITDLPVFSPIL